MMELVKLDGLTSLTLQQDKKERYIVANDQVRRDRESMS